LHSIQRYPRNAREPAFLIGGIETGNVPAGIKGEYRDRKIVNWPGQRNYLPFASFVLRAPGHHVPPATQGLESELAGDSSDPYALKCPVQTLARRKYRLPRSLGEVNVSWMARRS
jgi:hypothetical protein